MLPCYFPNIVALRGVRNKRARRFALRFTVASVLAAFSPVDTIAAASSVQLAQSESYSTVNIPAGPLSKVLNEYAQAVGVNISFDAGELEGFSSEGIYATVTISEGFEQLLRDSGFKAARLGDKSYILEALPTNTTANYSPEGEAQTLGGVVVRGSGPVGSAPSDSYTVGESSSATGLDLSLKETPQSITTFTAQQIQDQGLLDVTEVLEQTPGITLVTAGVGGAGSQPIYSRTLPVKNITLDGVMASTHLLSGMRDGQIGTQDSFLYERIDIVRGSTSLTSGSGNPSASLNFVRKHPYYERHLQANFKYGSWNTRRGEFDFSTPLTENGRWRARIAAAQQKGNHWVDGVNSDRQALSLITALDITDSDTLSLGMTYNKFTLNGASPHGVARWSAVDIPFSYPADRRPPGFEHDPNNTGRQAYFIETEELARNLNSAAPWSKTQREYKNYFVSWEHIFKNDWSLRLDYNHANNEDDSLYGEMGTRYYVPTLNKASYVSGRRHQGNKVDSYSAIFKGHFDLFGNEQQFAVGANSYRVENLSYTYRNSVRMDDNALLFACQRFRNGKWGSLTTDHRCRRATLPADYRWGLSGIDIDSWDEFSKNPELTETYKSPAAGYSTKTRESGLFFSTFLRPTDYIGVIVGGRWGKLKRENSRYKCPGTSLKPEQCGQALPNTRFNPKENPGFLPYYGLIVNLSENISAYGSYTTSYEGQNRQKQYSPEWLPPYKWVTKEAGIKGEFFNNRLNFAAAYFDVTQKNFAWYSIHPKQEWLGDGYKVKGYELSIAGHLTPKWLITAGYVNQKQESPEFGSVRTTMLDLMDFTASYRAPRHSLKLFSSYKFDNGLSLGGGLRWQSAVQSDWHAPVSGGGKRILRQDPFTVVDVMAKYQINKNFSAQLNINNLFDKVYYQHEKSYISGAPRNYLLSVGYRF